MRTEGEKYSLQLRTSFTTDETDVHIIKYDRTNRKRYLARIEWEEMPDAVLAHSTITLDPELDEIMGNLLLLDRLNKFKV